MDLNELYQAIIDGEDDTAAEIAQKALDAGMAPAEIIGTCMVPAMDEVGKLFAEGEYFVPDLMMSAMAMKAALAILQPVLKATGGESAGYVIIGTVKGDLHDIGKNLVASLLEGAGFEVQDLGTDVSPEAFVEAAKKDILDHGRAFVCMSALLTTTMGQMEQTIQALQAAGIRDKTTVLIGGAPVTEAFAKQIGADVYTLNASETVQKMRQYTA